MRKDYRPKWSPITEVPVIPVHEDMEGRDAPDQHPIEAITGLADAIASKQDAQAGKGLSSEDYTEAEKNKLATVETGAEANRIEGIEYDGTTAVPDADRRVTLDVYTKAHSIQQASVDASTGVISLKNAAGDVIATVATPMGAVITSATYDAAHMRLDMVKADGTHLYVPLDLSLTPYLGSDSITTSQGQDGIVLSVSQPVLDALDNTVRLTGAQAVAGTKKFTSNPWVTGDRPILWMVSDAGASDTSVQYGELVVSGNSTYSDIYGGLDVYSQADGVFTRLTAWDHARSHSAEATVKAYDDGTSRMIAPTYSPTDSQGAPTTVPSGTVITEGRLAVDPQVVHTYGAETIAGKKTFTSKTVHAGAVECDAGVSVAGSPPIMALKSSRSTTDVGSAGAVQYYAMVDGASTMIGYSDLYILSGQRIVRTCVNDLGGGSHALGILVNDSDNSAYAYAPSYIPVDGDGNPTAPGGTTVITQAMLAASPSVVHRTGAETIAGNKTLTGRTTFAGAVDSKSVITPAIQAGDKGWYKVFTFAPPNNNDYTLVLWSSPRSPVLAQSAPSGTLMVSVRSTACQVKWTAGMADATESALHKTALIYDATGESPVWDLWVQADDAYDGRYLQRMAEFTSLGPASYWTALSPAAEDAQEELPSGEGITVYYSEA